MGNSAFQFTNPELVSIQFSVNKSYKPEDDSIIKLNIRTEVTEIQDMPDGEEQNAKVSVTVTIGEEKGKTPLFVKATEEAAFKWKKGDFNEEEAHKMLSQNGAALLISYIRPVIASVTAASRLPAYNLPFIDVTQQEKE